MSTKRATGPSRPRLYIRKYDTHCATPAQYRTWCIGGGPVLVHLSDPSDWWHNSSPFAGLHTRQQEVEYKHSIPLRCDWAYAQAIWTVREYSASVAHPPIFSATGFDRLIFRGLPKQRV